jgi:hypothetical protein
MEAAVYNALADEWNIRLSVKSAWMRILHIFQHRKVVEDIPCSGHFLIIPCRVYPVGEKQCVKFSIGVNPETGSGESCMAETV